MYKFFKTANKVSFKHNNVAKRGGIKAIVNAWVRKNYCHLKHSLNILFCYGIDETLQLKLEKNR